MVTDAVQAVLAKIAKSLPIPNVLPIRALHASCRFIDDCVEGIIRLTDSDFGEPLNIGSEEMVCGLSA